MTASHRGSRSGLAVPASVLIALLAMMVAALLTASTASAQCGTQMSSCRNCHEVKGALKVNTKGEWHTTHAFGDFCVTCHGGDAKAKDAVPAHADMIKPLQNITVACATCHPADLKPRADKFASILGVTAEMGSGAPSAAQPAATPAAVSGAATMAASASCGPIDGVAVGSLVDYNLIAAAPAGPNVGNIILAALIAAMSLTWAGLATWSWLDSARKRAAASAAVSRPASLPLSLQALLPALAASDESTLRAIGSVLTQPGAGPRALETLGRMSPDWLAAAASADPKDLALLLARQPRG